MERPPLQIYKQAECDMKRVSKQHAWYLYFKTPQIPVTTHVHGGKVNPFGAPVVGNEGEFCCTALSSSSSLSSSDRLLPRAEVMAAADESDDFCLFGKLSHREKETTIKCFMGERTNNKIITTRHVHHGPPVDVVFFNVRLWGAAAAVPGQGAFLGRT